MRSRLEADYARHLDELGYRWEYEPQCYASENGQWLPDFGCSFADHGPLVMLHEVKPAGPLIELIPGRLEYEQHVDAILRQMMVARASEPDCVLELVFWQYGGPAYLHLANLRNGHPWVVFSGALDFLWTGMGQYQRLREDT